MGNERLRRKAEEQSKRINEAYDRIKDGNFKSSSQNSHRSYQSERVRTVYVEKEKPIYIKKSSGFSKAFAGLTATGMVISMTMCANRGEYHRQNSADFQYTISTLEAENSRFQHLLDQIGLDLPKSTETLKERIARWRLQIPREIYDQLQSFESHSQNVISAMDDILDDFKSASDDDAKQDALISAKSTIASFYPKDHPSVVALNACDEAQLKQWVRASKRHHENFIKTGIRKKAEALLEEARRKEAAAEHARQQEVARTMPSNREYYESVRAAALEEMRRREEAARLHPIPPSPEELAAQEIAYQQRQEAERAAAAEQARMQALARTAIPAAPSNFPTAEDMAFASRRVAEGMTWEQALRLARKNRTKTKQ